MIDEKELLQQIAAMVRGKVTLEGEGSDARVVLHRENPRQSITLVSLAAARPLFGEGILLVNLGREWYRCKTINEAAEVVHARAPEHERKTPMEVLASIWGEE